MKKVSVRTIAAGLGISPSTVARALSGSMPVAEETRLRVLKAAREMGYRRSSEHKRFLLIVSDVFCSGAYDRSLVPEIISQCLRVRAGLVLVTESNLEELRNMPFNGLFSVCYNNRVNRFLAESFNCPVVCFNNYQCHWENIYSVNSDDVGAISAAVEYFWSAGHRRIGLLAVASHDFSHKRRKKQFMAAIGEKPGGTGFLYEISHQSDYWEIIHTVEADAVTALLLPHEGFDLQLLKILSIAQKKIPGDISLITWENSYISRNVEPPLTTFGQDFAMMAQQGVELMISLLHFPRQQVADVSVPYRFFDRRSVSAPPAEL